MNPPAQLLLLPGLWLLATVAPLVAGEAPAAADKAVIQAEAPPPFNAVLTAGWDSLYIFRGVNVISHGAFGNDSSYGSGVQWNNLDLLWNPTPNDTFTVSGCFSYGTQSTTFKEIDYLSAYTHKFGDLALSGGYSFYYIYPVDANLTSHELNAKVAYTFKLGRAAVTPAAVYYYNLGPDVGTGNGFARSGASFLTLRVDAAVPLVKDIVAATPWVAYGNNFQYSPGYDDSTGSMDFYNGPAALEFGLGFPVKITSNIILYGYGAYSHAFANLWGTTDPNTFWGGAKIVFAF